MLVHFLCRYSQSGTATHFGISGSTAHETHALQCYCLQWIWCALVSQFSLWLCCLSHGRYCSHAVEAYTAIPYNERTPCPTNPNLRPAYQGSNPISDIWCLETFRVMKKYFRRWLAILTILLLLMILLQVSEKPWRYWSTICYDNGEYLCWYWVWQCWSTSTVSCDCSLLFMVFGNLFFYLSHGMSYPISGLVKSFVPQGYNPDKPIVVSYSQFVVAYVSSPKASWVGSCTHGSCCVWIHRPNESRAPSTSCWAAWWDHSSLLPYFVCVYPLHSQELMSVV